MFLISCSDKPQIETRVVVPVVDRELRTPFISPDRVRVGLADAALIVADLIGDRDCANAKIMATDAILTDAESRAGI